MSKINHGVWSGQGAGSVSKWSGQIVATNLDLKRKLEMEWERPGVRCPNHLVKWGETLDTIRAGWVSETTGLFFGKGKKRAFPSFVGKGLRLPKKWRKLF